MSATSCRRLRTASLLAILLVTLAACGRRGDVQEGRELVYGLTLVPSGIDPHIHASAELGIPLRSVYDTLVWREPQLNGYVPGLATAWEVSDDGLTYTFDLRQDMTFHDGTSLNAVAVQANLNRILDPDTGSQKAVFLLGPVASVEVLDDFRLAIILSSPYPPLLDGLSQPYLGIASPAALAENDNATYQFHQVGSGPYRFVEYVPGDRLVLERNDDYAWGPDVAANPGPPSVERIVFRFYEDEAARTLALESGEAQVMGELLPTDAEDISGFVDLDVIPVPIPGQPLQFMFNTARAPTDRQSVRRALLAATDRPTIVQTVYQGLSPVAHGPLSSSTLAYAEGLEGKYGFEPARAQDLLDSIEAIDSDSDGLRDIQGVPIVIDIVVPPWGLGPDVAQLLESQWETTLQIQVNVRQVAEYTMLSEAVASGEYNVIAFNTFGLDPILLNSFYVTGGFNNWMNVSDPDLDALLLQAAVEVDPDRRTELYGRAQERIMELALVVPIREYVNLNGYATDVLGLHFTPQGWFPYLADLSYRGSAN